MTKRGKILRDPLAGPGLLIAEGRQYQFVIDAVWKSEIPPRPGLVVDINFDAHGKVAGIAPVPDFMARKEQAQFTVRADKGPALRLPFASLAESELAQFVAAVLLLVSWFLLAAVSVEVPFTGALQLTFWQLLRSLGSGAYGVLAFFAIAGPFLHCFWKDRQAAIGGLLPLLLIILTAVLLVRNVDALFANGKNLLYPQMPKSAREGLMSAVSFGLGTYVSVVVSVYFALLSVKRFRFSKHQKKEIKQLEQATA